MISSEYKSQLRYKQISNLKYIFLGEHLTEKYERPDIAKYKLSRLLKKSGQ